MIIGIDFDGTCVTHEFPLVGNDIGAVPVLKKLVEKGHELILFTMRSHMLIDGVDYLQAAIEWFEKHDIPLYGINENPDQHIWTCSPKPYCHLYIDDTALGCPLKIDFDISDRPFIDWEGVEALLTIQGYL